MEKGKISTSVSAAANGYGRELVTGAISGQSRGRVMMSLLTHIQTPHVGKDRCESYSKSPALFHRAMQFRYFAHLEHFRSCRDKFCNPANGVSKSSFSSYCALSFYNSGKNPTQTECEIWAA
ncbi:hypothetical protein TNCV_2568551 [Trichonephila clavipes]|uniref:Uncharacterized protein n=1 Tax=Trichonephila clavipes TaxID=2585209 RepID=A0A8X6WKQ7_TRICX|nr:hypothetical protein TNCV_2568551 [Trichonephila clavipes]